MPAPWCRRCFCARVGAPGGGFCLGSRIFYPNCEGSGVIAVDDPPYLPRKMTLTLPAQLDLQLWCDPELGAVRPFLPSGLASLCPGSTYTWVLETLCTEYLFDPAFNLQQYLAGGPYGLICPSGVGVYAGYRLNGAKCPSPALQWWYWWERTVPDCSLTDFRGVTPTGRIGTTILIEVPVFTAGEAFHRVRYYSSRVAGNQNWPAITWHPSMGVGSPESVADALALCEAQGAFLRGELARPAKLFNGPWYFNQLQSQCALGIPVSFDPIVPLSPQSLGMDATGLTVPIVDVDGAPCTGSEDNVGFTGITVQAGDVSLPATPKDAILRYVSDDAPSLCLGEDYCRVDCVVADATGFSGTDLTTEAFPAAVEVRLPDSLNMSYRDGTACGNNGPNRPSPWTLAGPARCTVRLPDDVESPPYCGADFFVAIVVGPWATAFMLASTAWENCGIELWAGYRPAGTDCSGSPLNSPLVWLSIGFVRKSPTSVALDDAVFQMFTMARVYIQLEQIVGLTWSVPLHGLRLGPEFRFGDFATTPFVQPDDPILKFFGVDNDLGWTPQFDFDGSFYEDYVPTVANTECVGYSYHPGVYHSSIARTISGVNALADYCGQAAAFQRCARGANHAHQLIVRPTHGPRSIVRPEAHMRYCAAGASCLPLEPCP